MPQPKDPFEYVVQYPAAAALGPALLMDTSLSSAMNTVVTEILPANNIDPNSVRVWVRPFALSTPNCDYPALKYTGNNYGG